MVGEQCWALVKHIFFWARQMAVARRSEVWTMQSPSVPRVETQTRGSGRRWPTVAGTLGSTNSSSQLANVVQLVILDLVSAPLGHEIIVGDEQLSNLEDSHGVMWGWQE